MPLTDEAGSPAILATDLVRLDELLSALPLDAEAMLPSQLDGFLAGLLILPEPVAEADWVPQIWNHYPLEGDDLVSAKEVARLASLRKSEIAFQFGKGGFTYEPVFELDTDGSFFWEVWFEGYEQAIVLQKDVYDTLLEDGDEDTRKAVTGLVWVALAAHRKLKEYGYAIDRDLLHEIVPEILPRLVENLFRRRHGLPAGQADIQALGNPAQPMRLGGKIGRNEPCPCGSGKKYKKCCGR